jgi:AhpD family alkylhydroperoxidase
MNRKQVYQEIEQTLGLVPSFFKPLSDATLELEWNLFKRTQLEPSAIPNKYRELIGLGIAAVIHCRYCTLFHTEAAKMNGATEAEIEEAAYLGKNTAGWSTFLNGLQIDYEQFKDEVRRIGDFVKSKESKPEDLAQSRASAEMPHH